MSAKPSVVPTWNTSGTNRTAPTGGQRSTGYAIDEIPTSGLFNNEQNLYGQWLQYLNDGVLDGNVELLDDLQVDGNVSAGSDVAITGDLTVGGTVSLPARSRTLHVSAMMARLSNGAGTAADFQSAQWNVQSGDGRVHYPIAVETGDVITGWQLSIEKNSANTTTITAQLVEQDSTAPGGSSLDLKTTSANAPGAIVITGSTLTATVAANKSYHLVVFSSTGAADKWRDAEVTILRAR